MKLGDQLKAKRGNRGLREVASEIGVSTATISRIERGFTPDVVVFGKICRWLKVDPAEILGVDVDRAFRSSPFVVEATIHFRADETMTPVLAYALGELVVAAQRQIRLDKQP